MSNPFCFANPSRWPYRRKADLCRAIRDEQPVPDAASFSLDELVSMMLRFTLFGEAGLKTTRRPELVNSE